MEGGQDLVLAHERDEAIALLGTLEDDAEQVVVGPVLGPSAHGVGAHAFEGLGERGGVGLVDPLPALVDAVAGLELFEEVGGVEVR